LIFFWIAVAMAAAALISKAAAIRASADSPKRYLFHKYFHSLLTMGILVLLWAGARYQNIPWVQTHIVALVLFLITLVWLGFVVFYHRKDYRRHLSEWKEGKTKKKYLP